MGNFEKMLKDNGGIKNNALSAHVNMLLRAGKIEDLYRRVNEENALMLLRTVAKEYLRLAIQDDKSLKLDFLEEIVYERSMEKYLIIKLFIACMHENEAHAFIKICEVLHKRNIKI